MQMELQGGSEKEEYRKRGEGEAYAACKDGHKV